jgi:chromosome segregation ATPase
MDDEAPAAPAEPSPAEVNKKLERQLIELQHELAAAQVKVGSEELKVNEMHMENDKLHKDLEGVQTKLTEATDQTADLKEDVKIAKSEQEDADGEQKQLQEEIDKKIAELEDVNFELESQKNLVQDMTDRMSELNVQLRQGKDDVAKLEGRKTELISDNAALTSEVKGLTGDLETRTAELNDGSRLILELEEKTKQRDQTISDLQNKLKQAGQDQGTQEQLVKRLEAGLMEREETIDNQEVELKRYKKEKMKSSSKMTLMASKADQSDSLRESQHELMQHNTLLEREKVHIQKQLASALERELEVRTMEHYVRKSKTASFVTGSSFGQVDSSLSSSSSTGTMGRSRNRRRRTGKNLSPIKATGPAR